MSKLVIGPLETERFILQPMGMLEALRLTNRWRYDPDILNGLMQTSKPRSLGHWLLRGPLPRSKNASLSPSFPRARRWQSARIW